MLAAVPTPDHTTLTRYGWDDAWAALVPGSADGAAPGRVARVDRGRVDVLTADDRVHADPRGHALAVGDWVLVGDGTVTAVLPRRTALVRATVSGRSDAQVLAANVDTVLVTVPLDTGLRTGRVERLLALAWESGATPVVVLTKIDRDGEALVDALGDLAVAAPGVDVVPVSAVTGDGLAEVAAAARGTTVLVGPSGAGKSTLANALLGAETMATGAVRAVDGKGRHTTVHRELLPLPGGGVLVDTPGLRAVGVRDAAEGIDRAFADVVELAEACRFADCAHDREPGCAVQDAVGGGTLPARRLEAYRKLVREDEWAAARTDARLAAERRGRWKQVTKDQRAAYRARGR
ncbi:ribosome small subunit-dependent GTPase A [Actinomycetospora straminea]|uniref:Small ribosomal subunit biogenesis GTPase RsgA n=1 Tax=Actinomycetospora straminea TaxID=663607 RepID=A0ABP9DZN7_9PSEU|nr:ribosome small subunit-dependent GTPase A [Actinomycetospora straminea]MDD7930824.1 ribosome small subunit-dependent GTPase A [Actinomycetospora straminea]